MLADIKPLIRPVTRETVPDTPEEIAQVEADFSILRLISAFSRKFTRTYF